MDPQSPLKPRLEAVFLSLGSTPEERKERIHTILKGFYETLAKDILVGYFFDGKNLETIAENQAHFLLRAMGATSSYSGKAPALAHLALPPILEGHFNRRREILRVTLQKHNVPEPQIQTWLEFEDVFKNSIVKD